MQLRREGDVILVPLYACGTLLGAQARWNPETNQWSLRSRTTAAQGFLDEPLVLVSGQPFLLRHPTRFAAKTAWLSLEALRLIGRHGWDTEVVWDEAGRMLSLQPAQAPGAPAGPAAREITVPVVPAGRRAVVFDAGHARRAGVRGARGLQEGDAGLRLAQAAAATLLTDDLVPVVLHDGGESLEPREIAGIANALPARAFVGFHASERGEPGIAVWCWSRENIAGSGITWEPFEPPGGWARSAEAAADRSAALARALVEALAAEGVPARGPIAAPLGALEGLACPAVIVELVGFGSGEGAALADEGEPAARIGRAVAATVRAHLGVAPTEPAPAPSSTPTDDAGGTPP